MPAAKAAYCAGQQAPRFFWDLHDWIFANQSSWSNAQNAADRFRQQAIALGVDAAQYDACIKAPATEARIQRDQQDGIKLKIQGTPSIFVNDWYKFGASLSDIQQMIARAQQGLRPPPTPTPLPAGVQFFDLDPNRPGFTYDGSPSLGDKAATVIVLLFEDFKSPESAQHVASAEPTLRTKYVDTLKARLVFKFFPTAAPRAAVAALCAGKQGKFWEFRSLLYQKQAEWREGDDAGMVAYAGGLGLNSATFESCLKDEKVQAEVDTALDFGQNEIGVPIAPSYLILKLGANGQPEDGKGFPGPTPLDQLEDAIQGFLQPQAAVPPRPTPLSAQQMAAIPVGVDANGNFYRGNPGAPIRLVDFSDFQ